MHSHFVSYRAFYSTDEDQIHIEATLLYMLPILYIQYHICWWPGDLRSQGIRRHGIDHQKLEYSVSSIKRDNSFAPVYAS